MFPLAANLQDFWHAFTMWKGEWWVASKEGMYIQVSCPELVRIHKFALRGRDTGVDRIYNWHLDASKNGRT